MMSDTLAPDSALDSLESTLAPADTGPAAPAGSTLAAPKPPQPGELKYRLTLLLFPSILLVFVALYVTCLASGVAPEMGLLRAGGASMVLAILARVAIGILGDDTRMVMNEHQIRALAQSDALREKLLAGLAERDPQPRATAEEATPDVSSAATLTGSPAATLTSSAAPTLNASPASTLNDLADTGGKE